MTSTQPTVPWRGYVNQLVHGADLRAPVAEEVVDRVATALIEQRHFRHPVIQYHEAAAAALGSGQSLGFNDHHDEAATRDLLTRLVTLLDRRRPWPDAPYRELDPDEHWSVLSGAPVIARFPLHERVVAARLHRSFTTTGRGSDEVSVLVLRLRTGQTVALRSGSSGVELLTDAASGPTAAAFHELTGLEIGSQSGPMHRDRGPWS